VFKALELSGNEISPELTLVINLLRDNSDWVEDDFNECMDNIEWDRFMKLLRHHRVYPLVYDKLKKMNLSHMPSHIMESLEIQYNHNTYRMLQLSSELCNISKALDEDGIKSIMLKGPLLAKQLYDEINLRTSKDLDILIRLEDVERAEKTLHGLGYFPEQKPLNWKRKVHHLSYRHAQQVMQVEIHWRMSPKFGKKQTFDMLWQRRHVVSIANQPMHVLSNEDLLIYLSDHGARHGWFRLRWLVDIDRLLQHDFNLKELQLAISKHGGLPFIGQAALLSQQILSTNITGNLRRLIDEKKSQKLADLALECVITEVDGNSKSMKKYKKKIYSLWSFKQKCSHILIRIAPSEDDVALLPLARPFYFLYVPLRPFLWLWGELGKQFTEKSKLKAK